MIKCKITNNTEGGLALNWVRGGISIPRNSAAILSYDPFSIMDPNSSIYRGAIETIRSGVVSVAYYAEPPATMLDSLEPPEAPRRPLTVQREKDTFKNKAFNEFDPYHKNEFKDSVKTPDSPKPVEKDDVTFDVGVPKETKVAEKRTAETAKSEAKPVEEPPVKVESGSAKTSTGEAANAVETAVADKKPSKKTKKL